MIRGQRLAHHLSRVSTRCRLAATFTMPLPGAKRALRWLLQRDHLGKHTSAACGKYGQEIPAGATVRQMTKMRVEKRMENEGQVSWLC